MSHEIDMNRLSIFKVVASVGSFSKAAKQLKQPKSRISRNIAALEKEMGTSLIYRTTRQFQLTASGKELLQKVLPHLTALENVMQNLDNDADQVSGLIRMTVPNDIGIQMMADWTYEFQQRYPQCVFDLLVDNQKIDLVSEGVDLAIRFGALRDSSLKQKKIGSMQLGLFMSPGLFHRNSALHKISDLEKIPFISFRKTENKKANLKLVNQRNEEVHLRLQSVFTSNNFFVNRQIAVLGGGVCFLPLFIAQKELQSGDLIQIFKEWSTEKVPLSLLMPQQQKTPLRLKLFVEFITEKLKELL